MKVGVKVGTKKFSRKICICCAGLISILVYLLGHYMWKQPMTMEDFKKEAALTEETAVIGTNITLHQEIHGEESITYRYKLETDCPHWAYEDRYVSTAPLTWVKDGAAVETEATSIEIQKDGETYAVGQYFYVPILDLSMDDLTKDAYEKQLWNTAYQTYVESGFFHTIDPKLMAVIIIGVVGVLIMIAFLSDPSNNGSSGKEEKERIIAVEDVVNEKLVLYRIKETDEEQFRIMVTQIQDVYEEYQTYVEYCENDEPKWLINLLEHKWHKHRIEYFCIGILFKKYGNDLLIDKKILLLDREHVNKMKL